VNLRSASFLIMFVSLHFLSGCGLLKADPHTAFLGDSLIKLWWFPSANLGRNGDTTARMLARFPLEVPGHGYTKVVILGGTNDVLLGFDPATTLQNLEKLGQLAVEQHAEPVLCEIPPIFHGWQHGDTNNYKPQVLELNRHIAQLAAEHHWSLIDFYTPLAEHPDYSTDGVHMRRSGYLIMVAAVRRSLPYRSSKQ
jgi:acyl-CoA thioesterase I